MASGDACSPNETDCDGTHALIGLAQKYPLPTLPTHRKEDCLMRSPINRANLVKRIGQVPAFTPAPSREEAIVELFDDATRNGIDIRLVQVDPLGSDPHHCVGVVGGRAICEVMVTTLLTVGSPLEQTLLAKATQSAARAGRPDPLIPGGATAVPAVLESEPTDGLVPEVEALGIESYIGDISDATASERASRRDRRGPAPDWLSEPARETVEGTD